MKEKEYDHHFAFPLCTPEAGFHFLGLTKREYFAAAALSMLNGYASPEYNASQAVLIADALLKELENTEKEI